MTTTHAAVRWVAGDDWQINATLLDETGAPFDLTAANILWILTGTFGAVLESSDVTISVIDATSGQCQINIAAAKTSPLVGGNYTDSIRIVVGGITSTLVFGGIYVIADPWAVAIAKAAVASPPKLRLAASK